eukprot:10698913-Lingulodinium_polyedra.AAC.1
MPGAPEPGVSGESPSKEGGRARAYVVRSTAPSAHPEQDLGGEASHPARLGIAGCAVGGATVEVGVDLPTRRDSA